MAVGLNVTSAACTLLLTAFQVVKVEFSCLLSLTLCHIEVYLFTILFAYKYLASLFIVSLASTHQSPWTAGRCWPASPAPWFVL